MDQYNRPRRNKELRQMTTETRKDTRTNAEDKIKVYTMVRSEKISYQYHVPARSLKEAKLIMDESITMDGEYVDEYEFKDYDSFQSERYYASKKAETVWYDNPRSFKEATKHYDLHIDHLMGDY